MAIKWKRKKRKKERKENFHFSSSVEVYWIKFNEWFPKLLGDLQSHPFIHDPFTIHHAPCTIHHAPCTIHHPPDSFTHSFIHYINSFIFINSFLSLFLVSVSACSSVSENNLFRDNKTRTATTTTAQQNHRVLDEVFEKLNRNQLLLFTVATTLCVEIQWTLSEKKEKKRKD